MPNIEIHGFKQFVQDTDEANNIQQHIWELLMGAKYYGDAVVSYGNRHVANVAGNAQPYLRIWAIDEAERNDIVRRLEPLGIDIELPPLLDRYIPSKSKQETARAKLLTLRPVAGTDLEFNYNHPASDR